MTLGELIAFLEKQPAGKVCAVGLKDPHSYRGYYNDLAFEPAFGVSVAEMLTAARWALGRTFTGYKGGDYVMSEHVDVYLAHYGRCGEGIGPVLMALLCDDAEALNCALEDD